jgi:Cu-Zn family superoxide dismutase
MKLQLQIPLALVALSLAGCSQSADDPGQESLIGDGVQVLASAELMLADGTQGGVAKLFASDGSVSLEIVASGIEPGEHGFHLHQIGICDTPDFKSAGGHLNPLGKSHGKDSPSGHHLGDLPNLNIGNDRSGGLTVPIEGDQAQIMDWLFDEDGTAVMIHAGPDDYKTDPTGDAGGRVACGVLSAETAPAS